MDTTDIPNGYVAIADEQTGGRGRIVGYKTGGIFLNRDTHLQSGKVALHSSKIQNIFVK